MRAAFLAMDKVDLQFATKECAQFGEPYDGRVGSFEAGGQVFDMSSVVGVDVSLSRSSSWVRSFCREQLGRMLDKRESQRAVVD